MSAVSRVILCGGFTCGHRHESINGPTGCCAAHGPYMYFCNDCAEAAAALRGES